MLHVLRSPEQLHRESKLYYLFIYLLNEHHFQNNTSEHSKPITAYKKLKVKDEKSWGILN